MASSRHYACSGVMPSLLFARERALCCMPRHTLRCRRTCGAYHLCLPAISGDASSDIFWRNLSWRRRRRLAGGRQRSEHVTWCLCLKRE
jgi:hypothetical protein